MSRFWQAKRNHCYHLDNLDMLITTREIGDIPGCKPAVDIFIERTLSQIRAEIATDKHWDAYRNGDTKTYDRQPRKFFFSR